MKAISGARRFTALSAPWCRSAPRSGRSFVGRAAAESWCARSCAAADVFRCRSNIIESHLAWLDAEWPAGCRNGAELWRRWATGFRGSLRVVAEWATRRRRAERAGRETLRKMPPARLVSRLMLSMRDHLTEEDAITVASIERGVERGVPILVPARDLLKRFHRMVRDRNLDALPAWITDAAGSVLSSFGKGIAAD